MADENDSNEEGGSGGGKKLIIMIVVGLLLIGASVGGTIAVLGMLKKDEPKTAMMEDGEAMMEEKPKAPAIYYPIKPPIIVNFDTKGRQRFLQAEVTLLTRESDVIGTVELHMPMIRNALVLLIGGQQFEDLQTAEGKEFLRLQCLEELQRIIENEIGKVGIEQVLFTNFVMQ